MYNKMQLLQFNKRAIPKVYRTQSLALIKVLTKIKANVVKIEMTRIGKTKMDKNLTTA